MTPGPLKTPRHNPAAAQVVLFWLPLGAGGRSVRWNGRAYEAAAAHYGRRPAQDLYHSALEVELDHVRTVVEMTPASRGGRGARGVVGEGQVGARCLGRTRLFRYEVRRWPGGTIPDVVDAVGEPQQLSTDRTNAERLLQLVPRFPRRTWGRDEQATGDMWNSNSLTAWLLALSDHDMADIHPPPHGRAPGWQAGLTVAARQAGHRDHRQRLSADTAG